MSKKRTDQDRGEAPAQDGFDNPIVMISDVEERPLHPSARTTREQRREFQRSNESSRSLARKYGLNAKTVSKHRRRYTVEDAPMGRRSRAFTPSEVALIAGYRHLTCFNIRDCAERLRLVIPQINDSNVYRLLCRMNANRLPWGKTTSIKKGNQPDRLDGGCVHVSIVHRRANPRIAFVAFDDEQGQVFAFYGKPTPQNAAKFVKMLRARFIGLWVIRAPDGHPFEIAGKDSDEAPFGIACQQHGFWRRPEDFISPLGWIDI